MKPPPSLLVTSQGWGLIDLPLRASNEGLLRPRVARAQKINQLPSSPLLQTSTKGVAKAVLHCAHRTIKLFPPSSLVPCLSGWPVWSPTARVQRGPSEAARCASKGDQRATRASP